MKPTMRLGAALAAGCLTAIAVAVAATMAARTLWPDYAAAEPHKSYDLAMLITRLVVGALATVAAAWVTMRLSRGNRMAAWLLGWLFLALSLHDHLFRVWADYPAWYHFIYLAYLVPLAGITGRMVD